MEIAKITLDGRIKTDLNWSHERDVARRCIDKGLLLLWEIDLGLFSHLPLPLTNHGQYLSLGISLDHFRKNIWSEFQEESLGVSYYRGNADFSDQFHWDLEQEESFCTWVQEIFHDVSLFVSEIEVPIKSFDEITVEKCRHSLQGKHLLSLYCRDVAADYLLHLSTHLSAHIPSYLLLDITHIRSPLMQAQLIDQERYNHFHLVVKGCRWPFQGLIWQDDKIISKLPDRSVSVGFCMPSVRLCHPSIYQEMESAIQRLLDKKIPFRVIPESMLVTEWEGLDYILFDPLTLTTQGKRQLQGFCAAGGTVVSLGAHGAFARELSFKNFIKEMTDIITRTRKACEYIIRRNSK